ncbi:unnamed protein product [Clonostachys rosea f. rosea IK726]|uniref:Uncharacterized protein n=1 Tax=Clonostachys rosea f. rosea IK726 TaxID=1349383 RepID=A0ACA9TWW8_BIOOC|nr:unnamed protein product [Clonostachys rosea f. rosea IK726]
MTTKAASFHLASLVRLSHQSKHFNQSKYLSTPSSKLFRRTTHLRLVVRIKKSLMQMLSWY